MTTIPSKRIETIEHRAKRMRKELVKWTPKTKTGKRDKKILIDTFYYLLKGKVNPKRLEVPNQ